MGGRGSRPRKAPQEQKIHSERAELQEEDKEYKVGRRYKVARPLDLWSGENLDGTRHGVLVPDKDVVLLVWPPNCLRRHHDAIARFQPRLGDSTAGGRTTRRVDLFGGHPTWRLYAASTVQSCIARLLGVENALQRAAPCHPASRPFP